MHVGRCARFAVMVSVAVLVAAGCGTSSKSSSSSTGSQSSRKPQVGGVLTFGEFSQPAGLDPIVSTGQGTTGAIEMAAVYDTLMQYDKATGKYLPRLALSATPNSDSTVWTIKLRPNVKFSDGTPYNADAVVFGLNRSRSGQPSAPPCQQIIACPANTVSSSVYMALVKDIKALDDLTVQVTLSKSWPSFEFALSAEPSMIPSPTALKKCDPAQPPKNCAFNLKPVGAGPFVVDSFTPKEAITMSRNPSYWGGQVFLDGLKFVDLGDAGGQKTLDSFNAGQLQAAFLRQAVTVAAAHDAKIQGTSTLEFAGNMILLNNTAPPTSMLKVRQAIAVGIDPKVIDQRANQGKGLPTTNFITKDFKWYPGVDAPAYDPAKAKQLVQEAKAEGWDGKLTFLGNSAPLNVNVALAVQAMLQSEGMQVTTDTSKDTTAQVVQVAARKDYQASVWGMPLSNDDGAVWALAQNLESTSPSNRVGFKDPKLDQAINDLISASTDDQKKADYKTIMEELYAQNPIVPWSTVEEFTVWSPKVHDIVPTDRAMVEFYKAWMEH